jgi:hypothetical protein
VAAGGDYPISAGIKGGLAGSGAMALLAILYGVLSHTSIWYPINLLAAGFFPAAATGTTAEIAAFHLRAFLIAVPIHLTHATRGITRNHPLVDVAVQRVHRNDRLAAFAQLDFRAGFDIKSQFGLAVRGIRPVAGVTFVGKDRPSVTIKFDRWFVWRPRIERPT